MSQSTFLFAALLFAFFVFITIRGDLKTWLGLFGV